MQVISSLRRTMGSVLQRGLIAACAIGCFSLALASTPDRGSVEHGLREGLTGTWRVQVTTYNCGTGIANATFSSFLTFEASGTLIGTTANAIFLHGHRGPDHGEWEWVGSFYFTAVSEVFIQFATPTGSSSPPLVRGYHRLEQGIELTGHDSFRSEATLTFFDEAGSPVLSGCARARAARFH